MPKATAPDFCRPERIPATVPIRLVVVSDDLQLYQREASTVDVSLRGIRVRTPLALSPGTQ